MYIIIYYFADGVVSNPTICPALLPTLNQRLERGTPADLVDEQASSAPKNEVKAATRRTPDGRHIFWIYLFESQEKRMPVSVETTGYTEEHMTQAAVELRERMGRLL